MLFDKRDITSSLSGSGSAAGQTRIIVRIARGLAGRIELTREIAGTQQPGTVTLTGKSDRFRRFSHQDNAAYQGKEYKQPDEGSIVN